MVPQEENTQPLAPAHADKGQEAPSRREEAPGPDNHSSETRGAHCKQGLITAHIHSIKTQYDENPLLSITKPTSAPHNTPVQSPPTSPGSAAAKQNRHVPSHKGLISSLPHLPPPPLAAVSSTRGADGTTDGGTQPPNRDHVVSPTTAPAAAAGTAGIAAAAGAGSTQAKTENEEDSPISIINRRNIFATSDSRCSNSSKQVAGPPTREPMRQGHGSSSSSHGMAPQSFYFDKDRSMTDPHVKHEAADQKINISSWRQGADAYTLMDGIGNSGSVPNSSGSAIGVVNTVAAGSRSRSHSRSSARGSETNGPARIANGFNSSPNGVEGVATTTGDDNDDNYVPPPPPRYINSKLDDIRSRLLLNPRTVSPRSEEDMDKTHAAAVLSNMRSSPFRLSDRPSSLSSSRPGSSSFSGKGYARPVVRIHHREEPSMEADDNAVLDDEDGEDDDEDEDENGNERIRHASTSTGVTAPTAERRKEVTWNKNGKRVSRRLSAPETRRMKNKKLKTENRDASIRSRDSSVPRGEDIDDTYSSHEMLENEDDDEEEYEDSKPGSKGQSKKNSMGSRSRTGCWICRLRKKKCTEERPRCYNCDRLNLTCYYDVIKPDFISNPQKKQMKLDEIKKKTKEAKRNAMRKKPGANP